MAYYLLSFKSIIKMKDVKIIVKHIQKSKTFNSKQASITIASIINGPHEMWNDFLHARWSHPIPAPRNLQ